MDESSRKKMEANLLASNFSNFSVDKSLQEEEINELKHIEQKHIDSKKTLENLLTSFEKSVDEQHQEILRLQKTVNKNTTPNRSLAKRKDKAHHPVTKRTTLLKKGKKTDVQKSVGHVPSRSVDEIKPKKIEDHEELKNLQLPEVEESDTEIEGETNEEEEETTEGESDSNEDGEGEEGEGEGEVEGETETESDSDDITVIRRKNGKIVNKSEDESDNDVEETEAVKKYDDMNKVDILLDRPINNEEIGIFEKMKNDQQRVKEESFRNEEKRKQKWKELNRLLINEGYVGILESDESDEEVINQESVRLAIKNILLQQKRKDGLIKKMDMQYSNEKGKNLDSILFKLQNVLREKEIQHAKEVRRFNTTIRKYHNDLVEKDKILNTERKRFESEKIRVLRNISERDSKIIEIQNQLKKKNEMLLNQKNQKTRNLETARKVFTQFHQRSPSKTSDLKEMKLLQIIQQENESLKRQIQNYKNQRLSDSASIPVNSSKFNELRLNYLRLEKLHLDSKKNHEIMSKNYRNRILEADKETKRLVHEINLRPSQEQFQEFLRRYREMENQLKSLGRDNLQKKKLLQRTSGAMHAQGIVGEIMSILDCDSGNIVPTVRKSSIVISTTIPKMKKFVTEVLSECNKTFHKVMTHDSKYNPSRKINSKNIVPLIRQWRDELSELRSYQDMELKILTLFQNSKGKSELNFDPSDYSHEASKSFILTNLEQIIMESSKLSKIPKTLDFSQSKEKEIHPQLVNHFRTLFDVQNIEGVLPKMNQLYVFTSQIHTSLRALKETLGMAPKSTVVQIIEECKKLKNFR